METVLLYFGKVILCSGVMFLYYQLSLKDKTFHHYNRFYLLAAMLISLLLPLITIEDFTIEVSNDWYALIDRVQNFNSTKNISNDHIYFRIIFSALGLVSLYFLGKLLFGIFRIQQLKNQFKKESFDGINFYHTDLTEAPFSYFRNLFWKTSITLNSDVGKQILKHEMVHIEQKHSFDKIFMEIITAVFWFNPFFHIIKKEISLIHEYLADKKAVKQSDTKAFAQMLLASHFSGNQLPATSPFLSSNLKKRLKMLQKPQTKFGYARRIFALPVVFSVAFAYLVNAKNQEIKATNIEIEKAVSQIKKDTITPKKAKEVEVIAPKLAKRAETQQKLNDLSKKLEEKSVALKNLKPESKEFKKNVDELGALSAEIGKIASSQDFKVAYSMNNDDVKKINEFFKSDEWKNKVSELKNMNFEIPEIPEMNFDFPDAPPSPPNAPKAPNAPKVKVYSFNDTKWSPSQDMIFKSEERREESASTAKKRAKLEKERAKLDEKRAKLEGERAKLEAERRALDGNRKMYIYSNSVHTFPKTMKINADNIVIHRGQSMIANGVKSIDGDMEGIKYFINGREASESEFKVLDPQNIKSVTVNKNHTNGKKSGEIRVETK
ncbi:M56 family metallopeptidase [Chryseobacterium sp. MYb264]|uniref:M56 family metallopeptidase n=1 Tax=Chryseobacterium sp. MYb264 TaxID=2745153 RepID=UPI002E10DFE7|nr:M56 family metallopeptidase [Chryseobacterium sp. MYb264]